MSWNPVNECIATDSEDKSNLPTYAELLAQVASLQQQVYADIYAPDVETAGGST